MYNIWTRTTFRLLHGNNGTTDTISITNWCFRFCWREVSLEKNECRTILTHLGVMVDEIFDADGATLLPSVRDGNHHRHENKLLEIN